MNTKIFKRITAIVAVLFATVITAQEVAEGVEINGVVWATRNVDAPGTFAANPEDAGMFYQWNRKIGWSATDPMINSNGGTTWDSSIPTGTTWEAANNVCPSGWRVPTEAEIESLSASDSQWTTRNGVNGRIFGSGDNTIFLPAAGCRISSNGSFGNAGSIGLYWSSTQVFSDIVYNLDFRSGFAYRLGISRNFGFSVRCVAD